MKKSIITSVCSFGSNSQPQVGFFDSQETYDRLRNQSPDSVKGEPTSFTIDDDVTDDLTVWSSDDVQQLVQESNLTENA
jgi:hypothetical protein